MSWNIFDKDCLIRVGTTIAPVGQAKEGESIVKVELKMPDGSDIEKDVKYGDIVVVPLHEMETAEAIITPNRHFDVGAGLGIPLEKTLEGGVVGIVIDARGRPLKLSEDPEKRKKNLLKWYETMNLYDNEKIRSL